MPADHANSTIQYSREELLHIKNCVDSIAARRVNNGESSWLPVVVVPAERRRRKTKRGNMRTGLLYRVFFCQMSSHWITSWMNSEVGWVFNGTLRTVTWWFLWRLGSSLLSRTPPLSPTDFLFFRQDRSVNSGKSKGGGVCFMVNNNWCSDVRIISSDCSPHLDLMIRCRPFYLSREFFGFYCGRGF